MLFDLAGILCLHVDDLLLGGCGTAYRQTVSCTRDHVSRFACGKEIKENSVVAAFLRMLATCFALDLSFHRKLKQLFFLFWGLISTMQLHVSGVGRNYFLSS